MIDELLKWLAGWFTPFVTDVFKASLTASITAIIAAGVGYCMWLARKRHERKSEQRSLRVAMLEYVTSVWAVLDPWRDGQLDAGITKFLLALSPLPRITGYLEENLKTIVAMPDGTTLLTLVRLSDHVTAPPDPKDPLPLVAHTETGVSLAELDLKFWESITMAVVMELSKKDELYLDGMTPPIQRTVERILEKAKREKSDLQSAMDAAVQILTAAGLEESRFKNITSTTNEKSPKSDE